MKKDLQDRQDIELVVRKFYERLLDDELIGPYFAERKHFDLERHLPRMFDYWENVLFHTGQYVGNPLATHVQMNQQQPLSEQLFLRWVTIFHANVDAHFAGEMADQLKLRSRNIGYIMQMHVLNAQPTDGAYEAMLDTSKVIPTLGTTH
jgi:hemoglobin